jgi:hypothetical protein
MSRQNQKFFADNAGDQWIDTCLRAHVQMRDSPLMQNTIRQFEACARILVRAYISRSIVNG